MVHPLAKNRKTRAPVWTTKELAERFGITVATLRRLIQTADGPAPLYKDGRCNQYELPAMLEWWSKNPMTLREKARECGEMTYMTNEPCIKGHIALRWTSNAACTECAKEYGKDTGKTSEAA